MLSVAARAVILAATHRLMTRQERLLESELHAEAVRTWSAVAGIMGAAIAPPLEEVLARLRYETARAMPQFVSIMNRRLPAVMEASVAATTDRLVQSIPRLSGSLTLEDADISGPIRTRMAQWRRGRIRETSSALAAAQQESITRIVTNGMESGMTQSAIADMLMEAGMSEGRSRVVARTEVHTAVMVAEDETTHSAAEQLDLKLNKTWISTKDQRTRESHQVADGQTVGMDEMFVIGDVQLRYPGDPDGPPEETINCRCVLAWSEA